MSNIFNGFFDNLVSGVLNPKGNLADYSHASRTFVKNQFRLAPKVKFLYHVYFDINKDAVNKVLPTWKDRHTLESGLMVKQTDLPSFTVQVETKKKYNRTKNVQTGVTYEPLSMAFHDDNLGMMTGMLEAYFRYYYTDPHGTDVYPWYRKQLVRNNTQGSIAGVAGYTQASPAVSGPPLLDNTYKGSTANQTLHGLNSFGVRGDPFFNSIHINQMTRHTFTKFKLVNPMIESWRYGDMNYAGGGETNDLSVSFRYETVWIERGSTSAGRGLNDTNPTGFGDLAHYDVTPSPLNITGGGSVSLLSNITAAGDIINNFVGGDNNRSVADLFDYKQTGKGMTTLGAIIGGVNILKNMGQLTEAGVMQEVGGLVLGGVSGLYDNVVSGESGFGGADE